jgi:hypothetical protein
MSTNVIPTEEELGAAQFNPVRTPRALEESDLRQCADPRGIPDEGVPIFAIAARDGVVVNEVTEHEYEATAVLYATRDGEHVAEYHVAGGLQAAPRARVVESVDELDDANGVARDYAREALDEHPELDAPEVSA